MSAPFGAAGAGPGSGAGSGSGSGPGSGSGAGPERRTLLGRCWSCRVLGGAGLLAAALWIYRGPRSRLGSGVPPTMATIAQITLAIGVGAWGVVILVDPVGKQLRKEP